MRKVLIITPRAPFRDRGADEQERMASIRWFIEQGYEVSVITKIFESDAKIVEEARLKMGIRITPVLYTAKRGIWSLFRRLIYPLWWDGAAYEFTEPQIQDALAKELTKHTPDLVWCDHSHLWPLYDMIRARGIPVVTRSIDFEPVHLFDEEGVTLRSLLLWLPKLLSEWQVVRKSTVICTLNSHQARWFAYLGGKAIVLPLQFLWRYAPVPAPKESNPLHVVFMGSSYTITHNLEAFKFVALVLAPALREHAPGSFVFHVTGAKFPPRYNNLIDGTHVIFDGYIPVEQMDNYLSKMQVVVSPSVKRVGMQGKVFEPLSRGLPLITSPINLVGYPLSKAILAADTKEDYIARLLEVRSLELRAKLFSESKRLSNVLFSEERIGSIMSTIVDKALGNHD